MEFNIIGDIAGQYDALQRLVAQMPKAKVIGVGDLVDRGPDSRKVIEWFMEDPENRNALRGNHEDMMLDWFFEEKRYDHDDWFCNGGLETLKSYGAVETTPGFLKIHDNVRSYLPQKHIAWLETRPLYIETEDLIISHAPIHADVTDIEAHSKHKFDHTARHDHILWNRQYPVRRNKFQVFGHNSMWGFCWFNANHDVPVGGKFSSTPPENAWAACLDNSSMKVLTGMHWPSMEVFQVSYRGY